MLVSMLILPSPHCLLPVSIACPILWDRTRHAEIEKLREFQREASTALQSKTVKREKTSLQREEVVGGGGSHAAANDYWQGKEKPTINTLHRTFHVGAIGAGQGRCQTRLPWLQRALGYDVKGETAEGGGGLQTRGAGCGVGNESMRAREHALPFFQGLHRTDGNLHRGSQHHVLICRCVCWCAGAGGGNVCV
jgi:hypothetical protein